MADTVQQIKDKLSIVDVVTQYVKLDRAGSSLRADSRCTRSRRPRACQRFLPAWRPPQTRHGRFVWRLAQPVNHKSNAALMADDEFISVGTREIDIAIANFL